MANLKGVDIQKGQLGPNRIANDDAISGIIIGAVAAENLALDVPTTVYNLYDVENLGITAAFDKANNLVCFQHLYEFYQEAGNGTPLHIMLVARAKSMSESLEASKHLLAHARGEIRQLAIAANPATEGETAMLNGIPADVYNAISAAQTLYGWAYENHMPCQIFLEGYAYGGNASSVADLRNLDDNLQADKVSVVIGQNWLYAESRTGKNQKYAAVGTALGVCSKAKVYENIGDNEKFNLTDSLRKRWIEPGLSNHKTNAQSYAELQTLETKGYVFGVTYPGLAGVRWNNDHTSTPIVVDVDNSMNEFTVAYGRVADKAVRELRKAYLPKVKTTWNVDTSTGKLSKGTLVALEDIGDKVFSDMQSRGEITYGKTMVDKDSDLLVERILRINYKIVPKGVIGEIKGILNLKVRD